MTMVQRSPFFARAKQAAASRKAKARLLPLVRQDADQVSMRYHAALAALRNQQGTRIHLQRLLQMLVMTTFIGEAYASPVRSDVLVAAKEHIGAAVTRAKDTGLWTLDDEAIELCAAIVTHHDYQLRTAPLAAIADATQRLDRFLNSQSCDVAHPVWRHRR